MLERLMSLIQSRGGGAGLGGGFSPMRGKTPFGYSPGGGMFGLRPNATPAARNGALPIRGRSAYPRLNITPSNGGTSNVASDAGATMPTPNYNTLLGGFSGARAPVAAPAPAPSPLRSGTSSRSVRF